MNDNPRIFVAATYIVCCLLWDIAVWGATTYLVFWRDHSGWWFLLALLITAGALSKNAKKLMEPGPWVEDPK